MYFSAKLYNIIISPFYPLIMKTNSSGNLAQVLYVQKEV